MIKYTQVNEQLEPQLKTLDVSSELLETCKFCTCCKPAARAELTHTLLLHISTQLFFFFLLLFLNQPLQECEKCLHSSKRKSAPFIWPGPLLLVPA